VTVILGAANNFEWIFKIGIPLLIAGFSIAMHFLKAAKKSRKQPPMNPPNRGQRKNPDLSDEVEAFLKSVQQRQQQGPGSHQPPRQPAAGRGRPPRIDPRLDDVVEAQIVEPAPVPTLVSRGEGFGDAPRSGAAVKQPAARLEQQAKELGQEIDQTDERLEEQIHATFDHQLGQFDASQATSDDATQATSQADGGSAAIAADLHRMLSDPHDIRRAIVVNEILNPPVDRW